MLLHLSMENTEGKCHLFCNIAILQVYMDPFSMHEPGTRICVARVTCR